VKTIKDILDELDKTEGSRQGTIDKIREELGITGTMAKYKSGKDSRREYTQEEFDVIISWFKSNIQPKRRSRGKGFRRKEELNRQNINVKEIPQIAANRARGYYHSLTPRGGIRKGSVL